MKSVNRVIERAAAPRRRPLAASAFPRGPPKEASHAPDVRSRRLGARLVRCRAERAVSVDGETSWTVPEHDGAIGQYVHAFASVQAPALPPRELLDLIYTVMKEL